MQKIAVVGGGAFGTSISTLLLENGFHVHLWCKEKDVSEEINQSKTNRFLPNIKLSENIHATSNLEEVMDAQWVFIAVPIKFLRSVLEQIKPYSNEKHKWVILSKGIENKTLMLPSQIIDDVLDSSTNKFVLGGPNFAKELALKQYSGATIGYEDQGLAKILQAMLANFYFKPYLVNDLIGVQVCSALKNVIALTVGIAKGAGFLDNTKALIMTLGLSEISKITEQLGGKKDSVYSFAGVGDLILTCTGSLGRNFKAGIMVGQGESLENIEKMGITAEGINTVKSVHEIIQQNGLHLPLCKGTYDVLFKGKKIQDLLEEIIKVS